MTLPQSRIKEIAARAESLGKLTKLADVGSPSIFANRGDVCRIDIPDLCESHTELQAELDAVNAALDLAVKQDIEASNKLAKENAALRERVAELERALRKCVEEDEGKLRRGLGSRCEARALLEKTDDT